MRVYGMRTGIKVDVNDSDRGELDAIADLGRLEALATQVLDASSWTDLLNGG